MDNNRRGSIVESTGSNGPETRSQLNTLKPQQRAPAEFGQRQPRPEFYQQGGGPYGGPQANRPPGQQQQRAPPPQQQQPRTPGDKASPWNLIRQALPPEVGVRGPVPSQQRPPPPPGQYYNMQQRPPPPPQDQQMQFIRQQPPQDRRPNMMQRPSVEDRQPPPFRTENGRPVRPVGGVTSGTGDDDEEVVVNTSVNQQQQQQQQQHQQQQQQQQPPINRRDSTVFGGGRPPGAEGTVEPTRQWQRLASMAQGKPMPPQDQYGRLQSMVMPEGQEQQRNPQQVVNSYNRQPQPQSQPPMSQDDDNSRSRAPNGLQQKPHRDGGGGGVPPLTRRDSVLDAAFGRRPMPPPTQDLQESDNSNRRPEPPGTITTRRPLQQDIAEYRKTEPEDVQMGGRRVSDYKSGRPGAEAENSSLPYPAGKSNAARLPDVNRDYEQQQQQQQQQPRFERKSSLEKELIVPAAKAVEQSSNRASELRKSVQYEAAHLKPVREQLQYSRADDDERAAGGGIRREQPPPQRADETAAAAKTGGRDYYAAAVKSTTGPEIGGEPSKQRLAAVADTTGRNRDEPPPFATATQSKNSRPDTLKIIKDNEPLRDTSNSKGNYRGDNDVGKSPSKIPKKDRSELKTPTRAMTPKSPEIGVTPTGQKKLPMNKVQVGSAPSPNLKVVRSKVGSLQNTSHKPGGGQVKIENRKLEWKAGTRIEAKNDTYVPGGGDKKIQSVKLQWNAKPKVGSLENKTHKPGGGDKKIETVKLDFKDKAKPKIGSKDNIKHTPGGGAVKIEDQKLEIKAQSKVGSLDNVKHKPGGGEVKIFDDKSYIKQTTGQIGTPTKSQLRRSSSMKIPPSVKLFSPDERPKSQVKIVVTPTSEEDLYTKVGTEIIKGGSRRSSNSRSPSIQNNIVIPEEAVRTKK